MSGVATAIAGAAVVGAVSSRNASKKAANAARESSDAQMAFQEKQANLARGDINRLFPQAADSRNQGYQNSMNFLSQGLPASMSMQQQGNVGAQNILAGSMPQIQNAIMGGQVNYDFMQPQKIEYENTLQNMLSGMPKLYDQEAKDAEEAKRLADLQASRDRMANNPYGVGNYYGGRGYGNGYGGGSGNGNVIFDEGGRQNTGTGKRAFIFQN